MNLMKLATLAGAILLATAGSAAAQLIKFGTLAPQGSPWHAIAQDMAKEWKAASAGTINVAIYPGGIAGDDPDMVRKLRIGQLQMAGLTGVGLAQIVPEVAALQMPMLLTTTAELNGVRDRISPEIEAMLEARGFKLLAWADVGWVHFFTRQPVRHPDDLKTEKLWVWIGDTTYLEAWKGSGYQPVALPATEIFTGLQSGLITAFSTTPLAALSNQWFPKANHMTDLRWAPFVGALVITTRSWNSIPEALRPTLLESARRTGQRVQSLVDKLNTDAVAVMEKRGLTVERVSPQQAVEWEQRVKTFAYPKVVGTAVPAEMFNRVQQFRDEYRRTQPQN
jgi:TRAP-type C4-dicarboxylate transport system substrate-binding protein